MAVLEQCIRNGKMEDMKKYKVALSIAGSDPSGGAGLQADLKTFSACGCYGATAVVAVVDENTVGVTGVHPIPVDFVTGQIRSVLDDIGADAVKIGMLHSSELVIAVKETLEKYDIRNIVLDPVMVATSGDPLLEADAVETLKTVLVPFARVLIPLSALTVLLSMSAMKFSIIHLVPSPSVLSDWNILAPMLPLVDCAESESRPMSSSTSLMVMLPPSVLK